VEISQIISTDVINITVTTPDPALAEDIAESYVDEYFDALRAQVTDAQADDIEQLTAQLEGIERDLGAVDDDIQEVFEDVLSSVPTDPNANVFVPDLSQLRPDLETRRVILSAEYERVAIALDQLELDSRLRITSRLVQEASPAVLADTASGAMLPAAGLLAGTMIGVALAVMAAAASRKSVDARQVAEVLDRPIVAELPRARSLRTARRSMIDAVPVNVARAVEELAVLAETHARPGESFSVLVVGAERAAGSTTLAALLAGRYATHGSQTLLVDVDVRDSELTRLFAVGSPGLRGLLALDDEQPTSKRAKRIDPFTSTSIPGLSVVGIGDSTGSARCAVRRRHSSRRRAATHTSSCTTVVRCSTRRRRCRWPSSWMRWCWPSRCGASTPRRSGRSAPSSATGAPRCCRCSCPRRGAVPPIRASAIHWSPSTNPRSNSSSGSDRRMSGRKELTRNTLWNVVNEVSILVSATLGVLLLIPRLGADDYGSYASLFALVGPFAPSPTVAWRSRCTSTSSASVPSRAG
ncbi:MAG: hypothetical protein R2713_24160, partial [Ilumatobacteraceae bacterium]